MPPLEVLAHRIVWCLVLLVAWSAATGRLGPLLVALRDRRTMITALATTGLIAVNWFMFIYAVFSGQLLQASLGYFINPLVNVVLGMVFLRERLRPLQWLAVGLATIGVAYRTWSFGSLPFIALALALSFGFYGLLRKRTRVDAPGGLLVETALLLPLALAFLAWRGATDQLVFASVSRTEDLLLIASGPVTALPLLWFVAAARRLPYTTIGFLQYIAPTLQFLLAVLAFDEAFSPDMALSFGLIWIALALFSVDMMRAGRRRRASAQIAH